jgi:WhiA N-terminal LAGLIDADG-like domain
MARAGSSTSGVCWRSRVSFSEDVRNELAAIAPQRECDRRAELSALFHSAGRLHLRGSGEVTLHLDVGSPAVARRAFSLMRSFRLEPQIRTYRQRAFASATRYELHIAGRMRTLRVLQEAGVLDSPARAGHAAAKTGGRARLLPARLPPRGLARSGLGLAVAVAPSRAADRGTRCGYLHRRNGCSGGSLPRGSRASRPCARLCEGDGHHRRRARRGGCQRFRARAAGNRGGRRDERARESTYERRSREPRPDEPRSACTARGGAATRARGATRRAPSAPARGRRAPAAAPVAPASRPRAQVQPGGLEGRDPPSFADGDSPRRNLGRKPIFMAFGRVDFDRGDSLLLAGGGFALVR